MPTYEYKCDKCGVFEEYHSINTVLTKCPKCSGPVRRLISRNTSIIFKGPGFYVTDSRSEKSGNSGSVSAKSENKAS